MITHKRQGHNQCGQTCVAMVADCSIEEVVKLAGKDGGTHGTHLIRALQALGVSCSPSSERLKLRRAPEYEWISMLPDVAILRVQSRIQPCKWRGHWVVKDHAWILDPDIENGSIHFNDYLQGHMIGRNFTSMIEINPPSK